MSDSFETSNLFALPPATSSMSSFYVHVEAGDDLDRDHEESPPMELAVSEPAPYFAVKTIVDRTITALLMVVALPLMLLVGLAIALIDGRPVFYRQTRVGKQGRLFRIWKFRTMCRNAESATGVVWSCASDPRVTRLGRWLRCSHLDELPQFLNVLVGDMNLIGPRPERPEFVRELAQSLPIYSERLQVRPGITGLAQLRLRYDRSVADVQRKVLVDVEYIRTTSFLQDTRILLGTMPHILGQLLRMWRADRKVLNNSEMPGVVAAEPHRAKSTRLRGHQSENSVEIEPNVFHFPTSSIGTGVNADSALHAPCLFSASEIPRNSKVC